LSIGAHIPRAPVMATIALEKETHETAPQLLIQQTIHNRVDTAATGAHPLGHRAQDCEKGFSVGGHCAPEFQSQEAGVEGEPWEHEHEGYHGEHPLDARFGLFVHDL